MFPNARFGLRLLTAALLFGLGCQPAVSGNKDMVRAVTEGVGSAKLTEGSDSPIFILEEYHTSRVGQLEQAVMLVRLHQNYGLREIGLEGAIRSDRPLDASWFQNAGGPAADQARQDVAIRMLAEGEINAGEFMSMVFPDVEVWGIESLKQYSKKLDVEGNPAVVYLISISEKLLSQDQIKEVNRLITQKKQREAVEFMLKADPWVRSKMEALKDNSVQPVEELAAQLREIKAKAIGLKAEVPPDAIKGMDATLEFFDTAGDRSETMANAMLKLPKEAPRAMIVGAAHTAKISAILHKQLASFVVVSPLSLNPNYGSLTNEQFERKNNGLPVRTHPGTLGSILGRKPSPVIEKPWAKSYANILFACLVLANTARKEKPVTDDVWAALSTLPEVRIDKDSFEQIDHDILFRAWTTGVDGKQKEVWARVGSAVNAEESLELESKLKQAIADLGGSNNLPPTDPPSNSQSTNDDEGPGDGKRGETVLNRVSKNVIAVFAKSRSKAVEVGSLSG